MRTLFTPIAILSGVLFTTPASAEVVFFDDFEVGGNDATINATTGSYSQTPDVDSGQSDQFTSGAVNSTLWVRATQGFGASRQGLIDEAHGDFTDPDGEQAWGFRYTNSGLTTAPGVIGSLSTGTTYTVTFDVVSDGHNGGTPYNVRLVTFDGANRNDARGSFQSSVGTTSTLAGASGEASGTDYEEVTLSYTVEGTEGTLGQDVAVRFFGATNSAIIDNVRISVTGAGNTYANWIAGFPGVGSLDGFEDDFDNDGLGNGVENYLGTRPDAFSSVGLIAALREGNTFTFSHPVSEAPADDILASYRWSDDLVTFHEAGQEVNGTTVSFAPEAPENGEIQVTATISGTVPDRLLVLLATTLDQTAP